MVTRDEMLSAFNDFLVDKDRHDLVGYLETIDYKPTPTKNNLGDGFLTLPVAREVLKEVVNAMPMESKEYFMDFYESRFTLYTEDMDTLNLFFSGVDL